MKWFASTIVVLTLATPAAAQDTGWQFSWDEHPRVEFGDLLGLELRARFQSDVRVSGAAMEHGQGDTFDTGRRRVGVAGNLGDDVEFQLEREFERANPWRDAFVNYRRVRPLQIQAGQFKLPFGLEETTSGTSIDFIYRSLASARLAPGRDPGVMLHGRVAARTLTYEVGVFSHDGDNARSSNPRRVYGGGTFAGRVVYQIADRKGPRRGFGSADLGLAFTASGVPEGFPAVRGKSLLGVPFFDADVWVRGARRRLGLQARWHSGPLSFSSEYMRLADDRRGQSQMSTDLAPMVAHGWYASGVWKVRRVRVAGRVEGLALGEVASLASPSLSPRAEAVLGNGERAATVGLAWHVRRWLILEGNIVRESIGSAPSTRITLWSRLARLQLTL